MGAIIEVDISGEWHILNRKEGEVIELKIIKDFGVAEVEV